LVTVAEGVETPLQLARLREIDCQLAQGYLFSRPRPADLLEPFIQLS
jgi:EAL domain-containing protein (putative c-di-GMP-specific phosphodiesterase class I)